MAWTPEGWLRKVQCDGLLSRDGKKNKILRRV